jgi:hypothetical protein
MHSESPLQVAMMVLGVAVGKRTWQSIVQLPDDVWAHMPVCWTQAAGASCAHVVRQVPAVLSNMQFAFCKQQDCVKQLVSHLGEHVAPSQRHVVSLAQPPWEPYWHPLKHWPTDGSHEH